MNAETFPPRRACMPGRLARLRWRRAAAYRGACADIEDTLLLSHVLTCRAYRLYSIFTYFGISTLDQMME